MEQKRGVDRRSGIRVLYRWQKRTCEMQSVTCRHSLQREVFVLSVNRRECMKIST